MKIMSTQLKALGIVDEIIPEPDGGAPSDCEAAAKIFGDVLERQLLILSNQGIKELPNARYKKFRHMRQLFDLGT
jgi:acetyl-CoA carboxylase carboxyl transferase subunit alpha